MISIKDVFGTHEIRTVRFLKSTLAEVVGTAMLVIVGCGSVSTLKSDPLAVAFSFGLVVAMVIWLFGHLSGAHINPSVSIGFMVTGHISVLKCVCYVVAQVVGAILGAAILYLVLPVSWRGTLGSPALGSGVASWQGFILEMIGTFNLVMTVFASCDRLRTDHSGSIALAIGFCILAQIAWLGNITGGSINPARALGPAIFSGSWNNHWVYWSGPIAGGIIAALLYELVFAEKTKETDKEMHHVQYNNCNMKSNGFLSYVIEIEPPAENKVDNEVSKYKGCNSHGDNISNFDRRLDKEQIYLSAYMPLDSSSETTSTAEVNSIHSEDCHSDKNTTSNL